MKREQLMKSSKKVIKDCALPNGAIVAANSSKSYFPKEAKNYRFVWPRDSLYTLKAASILDLDIHKKFFKWCMKAEGWNRTGLFYEKYHVNGKKALKHFQPDQTGSVLIAVYDYCKGEGFEKLVRKSADGLCKVWLKDHFTIVTQDLWEERLCFPDLKDDFVYSLAICSKGLECANEMFPNKKWARVAKEMKYKLLKSRGHFHRTIGKLSDKRVDASLLGLVWPSGIVSAKDKRMKKTVKLIESNLVKNGGVHRYEGDEYDGWMYKEDTHRKKGAGYWPLLNFWMSLYYLEAGNRKKALVYYNKVLKDVKGNYIPEQVFSNNVQVSVSPLCWSHAMFVIVSNKL